MLRKEIVSSLRNIVGAEFVKDTEKGALLVEPVSVKEVSEIMRFANAKDLRVFPMGGGSDFMEIPSKGIILSTSRLKKILNIDEANMLVEVEAGVVSRDLHLLLDGMDLFLPVDPTSMAFSTIGGNIATNAVGLRALRHRSMSSYVAGLEVVLPSGEVAQIGGRKLMHDAGCGIQRLFAGSRGAFGVITKAYLKALSKPLFIRSLIAAFDSITSAGRVALKLLLDRMELFSLELVDLRSASIVGEKDDINFPEEWGAVLIIETEGFPEVAIKDANRAIRICEEESALYLKVLESFEEREKMWRLRRSIFEVLRSSSSSFIFENVVVPRSAIVDFCSALNSLYDSGEVKIAVFGHIAHGNFHVCFIEDTPVPESSSRLKEASKALGELIARYRGAVLKRYFSRGMVLERELFYGSDVEREIFRRIKRALDLKGVMGTNATFML